MGQTRQVFALLWGQWAHYHYLAKMDIAIDIGRRMSGLAEDLDDDFLRAEAMHLIAMDCHMHGRLREAQEAFNEAIVQYNRGKTTSGRTFAADSPQWFTDTLVKCLVVKACVDWTLGYADLARQEAKDAIHYADELAQPYSRVVARSLAVFLYQFLGETELVEELARDTSTLATEWKFNAWLVVMNIQRAWARVMTGGGENDCWEIDANISAWSSEGTRLLVPYFLSLAAEARWKLGQFEQSVSTIEQSLEMSKVDEQLYWIAESQCLRGFISHHGPSADWETAERWYRIAAGTAQDQGAKALEYRAVLDLAEGLLERGQGASIRERLNELHAFMKTQGVTRDVQRAEALLAQLGRG